MSHRTNFHCETTRSACPYGEIQQCINILCDSLLTKQMVLSFNINILAVYTLLQDQTKIYSFLTDKENMLCTRISPFSMYIQLYR